MLIEFLTEKRQAARLRLNHLQDTPLRVLPKTTHPLTDMKHKRTMCSVTNSTKSNYTKLCLRVYLSKQVDTKLVFLSQTFKNQIITSFHIYCVNNSRSIFHN